MRHELQFQDWLIQEGLWDATMAGFSAFHKELFVKPHEVAFDKQVNNISSASDVVLAVDKFYKAVAPKVDPKTAKRLESKLESAIQRLGYKIHPKDVLKISPQHTSSTSSSNAGLPASGQSQS